VYSDRVIDRILPTGVAVAECFEDPPEARLWPEEEVSIGRAVESRRREYTTGRHCARLALASLGVPPGPILTGPNREPMWPAGVLGALTHCDGYRAAAVTVGGEGIASLGIDAELHAALPGGVLDVIARPDELSVLAELAATAPGVHWDRLLFSAKESIYKAWYPLARVWLGFEDARLAFDVAECSFTAVLHREGPLSSVSGRWLVEGGLVLTSVVVPAPSPTTGRSAALPPTAPEAQA
jgi:4'-phosphopantetheinyl transferase EntD